MRVRVGRVAVVAATLFCLSLSCRRGTAAQEDPADREALERLTSYLRIDTSNPPGNESAGSAHLKSLLDAEGIPSALVGSVPGRQSLYARLRSGTSRPALLLLHHVDVVPADAAEWSVPPFGATTSNGYLWSRGAVDIKSLGIAHLQSLVELKRQNVPLSRDVIFLAVADEEAGSRKGLQLLLEERPDLFQGVGFVLNEGGGNETVVDSINAWGIELAQKVPLWIRITARSDGGHGASPPEGGGAAIRLLEILSDLREIPRPQRMVEVVERQFVAAASRRRGAQRDILMDARKYFGTSFLESELPASYKALLRTTMAITTLNAGQSVNSVPSVARATLDFRLLPDASAEEELRTIEEVVAGRGEVEVLFAGAPAPASPVDTELWKVLERLLPARERGSHLVPMVTAGTTDSRLLRSRGMVAYGFSPFKINYYDGDTVHGVDERIRIRFFLEGVRTMKEIVKAFATTGP